MADGKYNHGWNLDGNSNARASSASLPRNDNDLMKELFETINTNYKTSVPYFGIGKNSSPSLEGWIIRRERFIKMYISIKIRSPFVTNLNLPSVQRDLSNISLVITRVLR